MKRARRKRAQAKSAKFGAAKATRVFDKMADRVVELIRAHKDQSRIAARAEENSDEERAAFEAQEQYEEQIGRFISLFAMGDPGFLRLVADKLEGKPTGGRQGWHDKDIEAACERTVKAQMAQAAREGRKIRISDFIPVRSDAEREWFITMAVKGGSRRTFNRTTERLGIDTRPGKPGRPREK
jgi:hypothetical protein